MFDFYIKHFILFYLFMECFCLLLQFLHVAITWRFQETTFVSSIPQHTSYYAIHFILFFAQNVAEASSWELNTRQRRWFSSRRPYTSSKANASTYSTSSSIFGYYEFFDVVSYFVLALSPLRRVHTLRGVWGKSPAYIFVLLLCLWIGLALQSASTHQRHVSTIPTLSLLLSLGLYLQPTRSTKL